MRSISVVCHLLLTLSFVMRRCVLLLRLLASEATASACAEMAIVRGFEVVSLLAWTVVVADHMPRDAVVRLV